MRRSDARRVLQVVGLLAAIGGVGATPGAAQTIQIADYFLLGGRNTWQYTNVADPAKRLRVVSRRAGAGRFSFILPFEEARVRGILGYGVGGKLCVHQISGSLAEVRGLPGGVDVDGDMTFFPSVCLGGPEVPLDEPIVAPIDGRLELEASAGPFEVHETARVSGTATTTWSGATPVATPAGSFDDVVALTIDIDLRIRADIAGVDVDEDVTARLSGTLARETGLVVVRRGGDTLALASAVLSRGPVGDLCPSARFLLPPGVHLVPGNDPSEREAVTIEPRHVATDGCGPTTARTRGRPGFVDVRANWPVCGSHRRVKLRARLDATGCAELAGSVVVRGVRTHFTAHRSACGDGVFDPLGEPCDVGLGCDDATTCTPRCTCEGNPPSSAAGAFERAVR